MYALRITIKHILTFSLLFKSLFKIVRCLTCLRRISVDNTPREREYIFQEQVLVLRLLFHPIFDSFLIFSVLDGTVFISRKRFGKKTLLKFIEKSLERQNVKIPLLTRVFVKPALSFVFVLLVWSDS